MRALAFLTILIFAGSTFGQQLPKETLDRWSRPQEPFEIVDGVYWVGTAELASYLIKTSDGLILIDGGLPANARMIMANIKSLQLDIKNVKVLLSSHAHVDHAGGLAELKKVSQARLVAGAGDGPSLRSGGKGSGTGSKSYRFPKVVPDDLVKDGEPVTLGNVTVTAIATPGHTPGCTSWAMTGTSGGKPVKIVFFCSLNAPGYDLTTLQGLKAESEFSATIARVESLQCDVALAFHASAMDLDFKLKKRKEGVNPFVDPGACHDFVSPYVAKFRRVLVQ
jgi:metallo-beta-lactamase class B